MRIKSYLLTFTGLMVSQIAFSQLEDYGDLGKHTEIYGGYGVVSTNNMNESAGTISPVELNLPFIDFPSISTRTNGVFYAGLLHHYNDRINFGFTLAISNYSTLWAFKDNPGISSGNTVEFTNRYVTLNARFNYNWIVKEKIRFYSGFSAGYHILSSSYIYRSYDETLGRNNILTRETTNFAPDVQVCVFGVRAGKNLAGFAEIGVGHIGLFTAGISYRFKKPTDR
jgi:hypothetical protein